MKGVVLFGLTLISFFAFTTQVEALTPIARFDVVPFQRINQGETFNVGVVAFSKEGIDRVEFYISGQGYSGTNPKVSREMSYNPRTDTWEYWVPISASEFSSDGHIDVEALVYGGDGDTRSKNWVLEGSFDSSYNINCEVNNVNGAYSHDCVLSSNGLFSSDWIYSDIIFYDSQDDWWNGVKVYIKTATENELSFNIGWTYGSSSGPLDFQPETGDRFIISRGYGLDPVTLLVNPNGSLIKPVAYVDVNGDDSSGEIDNSSRPYETVGRAMVALSDWMDSSGHGQKVNGAVVKLNPGTHTNSNGGFWQTVFSEDEWLTITANDEQGGNKDNTFLYPGTSVPTDMVKVENLTLVAQSDSPNVIGAPSSMTRKMRLWVHNSVLLGHTRFSEHASPVSVEQVWYTDSYLGNMGKAVSEAYIARGLEIEGIGDDAFVKAPLVINSKANDINPRDGVCEGGWCAHADCWQWWGEPIPHNAIIYNYDCTNCTYQGIFARTQDGNVPVGFQTPTVEGVAIVNFQTELVDEPFGARNAWSISTDHLLLWHSTFNEYLNFWNDGDSSGNYPLNITNFDVKGNNMYAVVLNAALGDNNGGDEHATGISLADWSNNHFSNQGDYLWFEERPGADVSVGDAMLDSQSVPQSGSTLINRLPYTLVPVDARNNIRTSPDIGAFEYMGEVETIRADVNSDSSINSSDALLVLRRALNRSMSGTSWQSSATTGDVNCDSSVTVVDALLLLREHLGFDNSGSGWCGG